MQAMRFVKSPKEGKITIELPYELKTKKKVEINRECRKLRDEWDRNY